MITKQTFEILNKNGDTLKTFVEFGKAVAEFEQSNNPNYNRLVHRQTIERELRVKNNY